MKKDKRINSINEIINDFMKSIIKNNYLTLFICAIACLLVSCSDKDNEKDDKNGYQLLYDSCWIIEHDILGGNDDGYDFDQYRFFNDGVGLFMLWKSDSDNPTKIHSSDYSIVFSYKIENSMLIIDYGFGYIIRYLINSISDEYLELSKNGTLMVLERSHGLARYQVPDYYMSLVNNNYDIFDTKDKHERYIISFYNDGTYESKSYSNVYIDSFITENGKFEVQNSRVKFKSNTNGSLLDGRIFMITGGIWETENGTKLPTKKM